MRKYLRDFCVGSAAYPAMELLWRGRTHWTMALAGGCGLMLLDAVRQRKSLPLYGQALLGGVGITAIELLFGLRFNTRHKIWDYRCMPLNWRGQVCLPYALLWCGVSAAVFAAYRTSEDSSREYRRYKGLPYRRRRDWWRAPSRDTSPDR